MASRCFCDAGSGVTALADQSSHTGSCLELRPASAGGHALLGSLPSVHCRQAEHEQRNTAVSSAQSRVCLVSLSSLLPQEDPNVLHIRL